MSSDRRALDDIAELCGARRGDHRDNVVMVVRSMLRDPEVHNARRARALAVVDRLVGALQNLIEDSPDPGTEALGAAWEGRQFARDGGGAHREPGLELDAYLDRCEDVYPGGDGAPPHAAGVARSPRPTPECKPFRVACFGCATWQEFATNDARQRWVDEHMREFDHDEFRFVNDPQPEALGATDGQ